jgi:hypothetical protein
MRLRKAVTIGSMALALVGGIAAPALAAPKSSSTGGGKGCGKNACTTTSTDTTAPAISVSAPSDGSTVSGTVSVWGSASDDVSLSKVEVSVDGGAWAAASGTSSWSRGLDTTQYADGTHTIAARAVDGAGNTKSVSRLVSFSNTPAAPAPDTSAPTVSISSPASGATVDGVITVAGSASDNVGVARVEVSVDGGAWAAANGTSSWSRSVDTSGWAAGSAHTIAARSIDTAGNVSSAATASVTKSADTPANGDYTVAPNTQGTWTSPEGTYIEVNTAGPFTIRGIYKLLLENATTPGDFSRVAPTLKVRVQDTYASQATTSVAKSGTTYTNFGATIYLKGVNSSFASQPDASLSHEYGHVWTQFHRYLDQQGDWSSYLNMRWVTSDGSQVLAGDSRLDGSYSWDRSEIIADDYRLLFGSPTAVAQRTHLNASLVDPRSQAGLRDFFLRVWSA